MTVNIRTFPASQVDQLEAKLNEILSKPESAGFSVAASCTITRSDGTQTIVLVFQKP